MSDSAKLNTVKAFASIGSEDFGVETLMISAGIGAPASALLGYNEARDPQVVSIYSGKAIAAASGLIMGEFQTLSFTAAEEVKFGVRTPYSFEWTGYACSPGYQFGSNGTDQQQITSISPMAAVGRLNMSIYLSVQTPEALAEESVVGSIAARLKLLTEKLIKNWQTFPLVPNGQEQELSAAIHARNNAAVGAAGKSPLQLWYDLLAASEGSTILEGLADIESASLLNQNINAALTELLLYSYGDFWGTIRAVCSLFNLIYRPDTYAPYVGQLVTMDAIADNPVPRSVEVWQANLSDTQNSTWPVSQVLVRGVPTQYVQFEDDTASALPPGPMLLAFPEVPGNGGNIQQASCPRYFTTPNVISSTAESISFYTQPGGLTYEAYREKRAAMAEGLTKNRDALQRMLQQYARQLYLDLALASSVSTLDIPFDHTWAVGRTYTITDSGSEAKLFTGFLTGVQHRLAVQAAAGGEATADGTTTLQFTHCRFGNFELPGI